MEGEGVEQGWFSQGAKDEGKDKGWVRAEGRGAQDRACRQGPPPTQVVVRLCAARLHLQRRLVAAGMREGEGEAQVSVSSLRAHPARPPHVLQHAALLHGKA